MLQLGGALRLEMLTGTKYEADCSAPREEGTFETIKTILRLGSANTRSWQRRHHDVKMHFCISALSLPCLDPCIHSFRVSALPLQQVAHRVLRQCLGLAWPGRH
jgi:hypothetical protein